MLTFAWLTYYQKYRQINRGHAHFGLLIAIIAELGAIHLRLGSRGIAFGLQDQTKKLGVRHSDTQTLRHGDPETLRH